jgi:pimeloyl-ACP methyl ester carboxylesterase
MFRLMKERLPYINVPVCLAHSEYDLVIPYQEMYKIANSVGNPKLVTTYTLEDCGHQVFPKARQYDEAIRIVLDFVHGDHTGVARLTPSDEALAS